MNRKWLLASVVGLGFLGAAPLSVHAQGYGADDDILFRQDRYEREVEFERLPGGVKHTLAQEAKQSRVENVTEVRMGNRTIYRAEVGDRILRVDQSGQIVSERDNDFDEGYRRARANDLPDEVRQTVNRVSRGQDVQRIYQTERNGERLYVVDIVTRDGIDRVRIDRNGRVVGGPLLLSDVRNNNRGGGGGGYDEFERDNRGDNLTYENLPGNVKSAVGKELGAGSRVSNVRSIRRDGQTYYRVEVQEGTRSRILRVTEGGEVLRERNTTEEGRVRVEYNELPGKVKSALAQEANTDKFERIVQITQDRRTWYVAEANGRRYWVDDQGALERNPKMLSDRNTRYDRDYSGDRNNRGGFLREERRDNRDNRNDRRDNRREVSDDRNANAAGQKYNDGHTFAEKVDLRDLPADIRRGITDDVKNKNVTSVYRVEEQGKIQYRCDVDGSSEPIWYGAEGKRLKDGQHIKWNPKADAAKDNAAKDNKRRDNYGR